MPRFLIGLILSAVIVPADLLAQTNCASRDVVIEKLEAGYGEAFAGGGLQNATSIYEVWFSEEKGTWTILMTRSDGYSCIMASGTNWRGGMPGAKKPQGTPS
jgi:hypothetical protein